MNRIAVILSSDNGILTAPKGLDFDHDGKREFVIRNVPTSGWGGPLEFYECTADNSFALVNVLDLGSGYPISYYPGDAADGDGDGIDELSVTERILNDFYLRIFEGPGSDTYPTMLTWESSGSIFDGYEWPLMAGITDTDGDGRKEIVTGGRFFVPDLKPRIVIYENDGDNSYHLSYTDVVPAPGDEPTGQSMAVIDDADGDGKREILFGSIPSVYAYESVGDDAYAVSWSWTSSPQINIEFIVDAGDLDGDGKKEILVGGLKPNPPFKSHLHILEITEDNHVEDVATLIRPNSGPLYTSATLADVDGDGHREIVFGVGESVAIYKNAGDNLWHEVWSGAGSEIRFVGAGDHDADGKDEIIFRGGTISNGNTGVWEIDPADAADMDLDGKVDAIDNCPSMANPGQDDADGDTVGNACDNCVDGPNPAQGPAVLGQTIVAVDKVTFGWPKPADVNYVRGDLEEVSGYAIQVFAALPLATSLTDATPPAAGSGFWYLVKPACPVGSWQSTLGAEPERDAVLP